MRIRILFVVLLVAGAASAANALDWEVTAAVNAVVIPGPEPEDGRVKASGYHRVTITSVSVLEARLPIRFKIEAAELYEDGAWRDGCSTGWTWASRAMSRACATRTTVDPCRTAVWETMTYGRLEGHPFGGHRFAFSDPAFVDCECV